MNLSDKIKSKIRDVHDFPKKGIVFKDITPVLGDAMLCKDITQEMVGQWESQRLDAIIGIESRGFIFGMLMAYQLDIPFIPIRKVGKLPHTTVQYSYELEYGTATMEIHEDAIDKGWNVLIHDDLLATGGTAEAAAELVRILNGNVAGFSFLIDLTFLNGQAKLNTYSPNIKSLIAY